MIFKCQLIYDHTFMLMLLIYLPLYWLRIQNKEINYLDAYILEEASHCYSTAHACG